MKKYVIDKLVCLLIGISMIIISNLLFTESLSLFIVDLIWAICIIWLTRQVLLLPIDLLLGKRTAEMRVKCISAINDFDIFRENCLLLELEDTSGKSISLFYPTTSEIPSQDYISKSLTIDYYQISRIIAEIHN